MDHQAHGLDLKHPIFNTPRKPTFTWTEVPCPDQYKDSTSVLYPNGVGPTLRLAAFERDKAKDWNPVLVNHEGFFTDVPGLENIAEGHSEKVLGSVSLVRQGRWFYWGYSIDPERMTGGAKDTLVNVLHYMRGKRDARTVRFVCTTRQILSVYVELGRRSGYKRGIEEHLPGQLTPEWRKTYTPEQAEAWLREHLPYVFSGKAPEHQSERYKTVFEVDADAMALGTPNRERSSLERWIALVAGADGELRDRARRCLHRYVHLSTFPTPSATLKDEEWEAWYARQRDRIVFIESTGFWWQEDPRVLEREHARPSDAAAPR